MDHNQLRPSEREPITGQPIVCPGCHQELSLFVAGYCGNERCVLYDAQPWENYSGVVKQRINTFHCRDCNRPSISIGTFACANCRYYNDPLEDRIGDKV